jgi:hypothetical protein
MRPVRSSPDLMCDKKGGQECIGRVRRGRIDAHQEIPGRLIVYEGVE